MLLKNKTAVITGCNRGIGFSILETYLKNGANVIACVRSESELFRDKIDLFSKKFEAKVNVVKFNLENEEEIEKGFLEIKKISPKIDILVNNAGINQMSLFQMTTLKTFRSVFDVNFFSIVSLTQKILKIIVKKNNSKIINIASNAADLSSQGRAAYAPSKAALLSFTKVLSKEMGSYSINVNAIAPGLVNTDMMKNTPQKAIEEALSMTPLKKAAEPIDVANVALFLASDQANHISGETIYVTGGM